MSIWMRRRAILALVLCSLFTTTGWALRGGLRPGPILDHDFPAGTLKLANLPTRVSGDTWEGVNFQFIFAGNTAQFQTALDAFAAIDAPRLELHVYEGSIKSFPWTNYTVNWMFEVWGGEKAIAGLSSIYRENITTPPPPPRLSVYLGQGSPIDWPAVHVPGKVTPIDHRVATSPWADSKWGVVHAKVFDMATSRTLPGAILEIGSYDSQHQFEALDSSTANGAGDAVIKEIPAGNFFVRLRCKDYVTRELYYENPRTHVRRFRAGQPFSHCADPGLRHG